MNKCVAFALLALIAIANVASVFAAESVPIPRKIDSFDILLAS